uniref:Uncharacterized protein n=1 Tax=Cryptomonas curvata TaxID=233186 RepID=A0A6T7WKI7_9CRYP
MIPGDCRTARPGKDSSSEIQTVLRADRSWRGLKRSSTKGESEAHYERPMRIGCSSIRTRPSSLTAQMGRVAAVAAGTWAAAAAGAAAVGT